MTKPLVSVAMGVYNCESTVNEAILSIVNQTYQNIELIICDDGSNDNTLQVVKKSLKDKKLKHKILKNDMNMGLNYTLNKCIDHSKGKYIGRMDGDDISLPNRFEKLVEFLESNIEYSFVSSAMIHFDENGIWGVSKPIKTPINSDLVKGSPFAHAASLMRKDDLLLVGKYSTSKQTLRVEDYDLWVRFYIKGFRGFNFTEPYYKMRDDLNAYKRRKFSNRLNEVRIRWKAFTKLKVSLWYVVYVFVPLIKGLVPRPIYRALHKKKVGRKIND